MSGVPGPRSFSLVITAPDVWVPVVETTQELFELGEVAEESVLRSFQEPRPERRYLYESRADTLSHLELGVGEVLHLQEVGTSSLITPFDERGLSEEFVLAEAFSEQNANYLLEPHAERFTVREQAFHYQKSTQPFYDILALQESLGAGTGTTAYAGIEGLFLQEFSSLQTGLRVAGLESFALGELSATVWTTEVATSEPRVMLEGAQSFQLFKDLPLEAVGFHEDVFSEYRSATSGSELVPLSEVGGSATNFSISRTEPVAVVESGFDRINRYGEDYRTETVTLSEAVTERTSSATATTESYAVLEAKTTTMSWTSNRSETFTLAETKTDGGTRLDSEARSEALSVLETVASSQKWGFVTSETASLSEVGPADKLSTIQARSETLATTEAQSSTAKWGFPSTESITPTEVRNDYSARANAEPRTETITLSETKTDGRGTTDTLRESIILDPPVSYEFFGFRDNSVDTMLSFEGSPLVEVGQDWYWPNGVNPQTAAPVLSALTPNTVVPGGTFSVNGSVQNNFYESRFEPLSLAEALIDGKYVEGRTEVVFVTETKTTTFTAAPAALTESVTLAESRVDFGALTAAPTITSVSPSPVAAGTTLVISGTSS